MESLAPIFNFINPGPFSIKEIINSAFDLEKQSRFSLVTTSSFPVLPVEFRSGNGRLGFSFEHQAWKLILIPIPPALLRYQC